MKIVFKKTVKCIFASKNFCEQKLFWHQFLWITSLKNKNYFWEFSSQWALNYWIFSQFYDSLLWKSVGAFSVASDHLIKISIWCFCDIQSCELTLNEKLRRIYLFGLNCLRGEGRGGGGGLFYCNIDGNLRNYML